MTPTQLIYEAWKRTPKPMPLPNGKTAEWPEPEMTEVPDPVCWLCGGETHGEGRLCKGVIRKTFTNTPYARATESKSLCTGCGWILAQRHIRNWSLLVVDGLFEHPTRQRIREVLLAPPNTYPWLLSIAVSGQKHISFPGYVNMSSRELRVFMEDMQLPIPAEGIGELLEPVEELYTGGFTKDEIQTGRYQQNRIMRFGLGRWRELEDQIAPYRGARLLNLAVWVAEKREGDDLSSTDSTQGTKTRRSQRSASTRSTAAVTQNGSKSRRTSGASSNEQSDPQQNAQQLSLFG